MECIIVFSARPITYEGDLNKVTFAASYLTETTQNHYTSLLQHDPNHPALQTWQGFVQEFGAMFGPANPETDAEQTLRSLQMGERERFASYITRFENHAFETGWNDAALQSELYRTLPVRIKDVMKIAPRARSYRELRDLAMNIDHRFWEYEAETRRNLPPSRPPIPRAPDAARPMDQRPRPAEGTTRLPSPSQPTSRPQPQQPANPRPTNPRQNAPPGNQNVNREEFERRRREGLCINCGGTGHYSINCPSERVVGRATFTLEEGEEEIHETFEMEEEESPPVEESENAKAIQELPGET
jgi:hypothetical protein